MASQMRNRTLKIASALLLLFGTAWAQMKQLQAPGVDLRVTKTE